MWILAIFAIVATLLSVATVYQNSSSHPAEKKVVTPQQVVPPITSHHALPLRIAQEVAPHLNDNLHFEMEQERNVGARPSYLNRRFLIKSNTKLSTPSGEEINLCITVKEVGVESDLIIQECVDKSLSQLWAADQFGRFHSWENPGLCMSPINGRIKKCNFNPRNTMSFNGFTSAINIRKNGSRLISYDPDGSAEEVLGRSVSTFGSANLWSAVANVRFPGTDVFLVKDDLPLDEFLIKLNADQSKCVAASNLERTSPLILEPCDASNEMQLWKYDEGGMIQIASLKTKCIVGGTVLNGEPSLMIGTPCRRLRNNNRFMYDVVTLKIVQARNNVNAFTVDGDDVVRGSNHPQNNAIQQFVLVAP